MKDLLVEIGVEELPHANCQTALQDFREAFTQKLAEERIAHARVSAFGTPRRLALLVEGVQEKQEDFKTEKRGPSVEKAYHDGKPTPALLGFLKGNGVQESETVVRDTGNGKYVFAVQEIKGKPSGRLFPDILKTVIRSMRFPKSMRWESTGFSYARPIRWILFLFGEEVIPFEIAGIRSNNFTRGHRTYTDGAIAVRNPREYESLLRSGSVIPDRSERRKEIEAQITALIEPLKLKVPVAGSILYDENTDLTEFPHALLCRFDEEFLALPPEVLISEMIEHQHYFPLVDANNGELTNRFIAVSNIADNRRSETGYRRVLRARLNDGSFFYNEDRKINLDDYLERLKTVTFHEKLGSMYDKVKRTGAIAVLLCEALNLDDDAVSRVETVVRLCKNDLVTLMVGEFPGLQGTMGYYYARSSGHDEAVARGVREHYLPRFAGDELPHALEGALVGVADRLDTIMSIFSIGLKPRGSKDPFALRRRVLAVIRIIIGLKLHFSIRELMEKSLGLYSIEDAATLRDDLGQFFLNRIKSVFSELGFSYDEIDASLVNVLDDVYEAYRRVQALHSLRGNTDFEDLLVSFRRMSNIIEEGGKADFSPSMLVEKEERALHDHFQSMRESILEHIGERKYVDVYRILSTFKPLVDNFFDNVLVMDENLELRKNRLGLLQSIIAVFSGIIDFSKIVQPGE
jgi:glycyl-tRNA synthetase beta chain